MYRTSISPQEIKQQKNKQRIESTTYLIKENNKSLDASRSRYLTYKVVGFSNALEKAQDIIQRSIRRKMNPIEKEYLSDHLYFGNDCWNVTIEIQ